jgi:hypothetical protein
VEWESNEVVNFDARLECPQLTHVIRDGAPAAVGQGFLQNRSELLALIDAG